MTSLYNIIEEYNEALHELLDSELDSEVIEDTLSAMKGEVREKGLAVAAFIANLEAEAAQVGDAEGRMKERKRVIKNKAQRLREYLIQCMTNADIPSLKNDEITVKVNKAREHVVIEDITSIPSTFIEYSEKVLKADLLAFMRKGKEVEGARLEFGNQSVTIK